MRRKAKPLSKGHPAKKPTPLERWQDPEFNWCSHGDILAMVINCALIVQCFHTIYGRELFWKCQWISLAYYLASWKWYIRGAGVAQQLCNGLPRYGPGFDSNPSQGTVNGVLSLNSLAVDGTLNTTNQPISGILARF